MSAFAVAIEAKSDIAFCGAYVCFRPKADIQGALKLGDGRWFAGNGRCQF
jgi:hypothetical protein